MDGDAIIERREGPDHRHSGLTAAEEYRYAGINL